ncbi:MAG TPA: gamma carbonic anhydrase family protein [Rhodocyclaceae bacterium]|nr:gamma carbonic anhydrase family protein [Rhodocyclaceae bacterium]
MPLYALGDRKPVCHADTWVAETATLIGSVILEAEASVFFGAVIRGDTDLITIGARSNIQDHAVLHTDAGIRLDIGSNVIVGHQAMLHGCSVGDGSLIGIGAIILNGAVIGKHCLVGAGAVVPEGKSYPDRSLILGTPAKVVRTLSDEEVQAQLDGAALYVARWRQYAAELKPLAPNP